MILAILSAQRELTCSWWVGLSCALNRKPNPSKTMLPEIMEPNYDTKRNCAQVWMENTSHVTATGLRGLFGSEPQVPTRAHFILVLVGKVDPTVNTSEINTLYIKWRKHTKKMLVNYCYCVVMIIYIDLWVITQKLFWSLAFRTQDSGSQFKIKLSLPK